jgi:hypothetical protein
MPNVPNVAGVPPLSSYSLGNIELVEADALIAYNLISQLFSPKWGIYQNGQAVITPAGILGQTIESALTSLGQIAAVIGIPNVVPSVASTIEFYYSADSPISNYPQEQGAFQSYDKVQLPAEIGLRLCCSGTASQRQSFLSTIEALRTSTKTVDIQTPEALYTRYNLSHYDYKRVAESGVSMIVTNCKFEYVPASDQPKFSSSSQNTLTNPQQPSSASQQSLGNVQPQLTPAAPNDQLIFLGQPLTSNVIGVF